MKSKAGRRTIGLPPQLIPLLRTHQAEQEQERAQARQLWRDEGWVFASPTGQPLNPNTDYHGWKQLLKDAGLREARLHDARHTAATVLLSLGVPVRAAPTARKAIDHIRAVLGAGAEQRASSSTPTTTRGKKCAHI